MGVNIRETEEAFVFAVSLKTTQSISKTIFKIDSPRTKVWGNTYKKHSRIENPPCLLILHYLTFRKVLVGAVTKMLEFKDNYKKYRQTPKIHIYIYYTYILQIILAVY